MKQNLKSSRTESVMYRRAAMTLLLAVITTMTSWALDPIFNTTYTATSGTAGANNQNYGNLVDGNSLTFYKIHMIANSPAPGENGVSNEMWVYLTQVGAGTVLHANMPYIFKPKAAGTYNFTTANATLKAKNTGVLAETQTMDDCYKFYAVYENTTPASTDPFYYVNINGSISLGNNGTVTVGPYRWIIRKTSKYGNEISYARSMRFIDDDTTGSPPFHLPGESPITDYSAFLPNLLNA